MNIGFNSSLFSKSLREYRGDRKQDEIAKELEINRSTISLLENEKQIPSLDILQKICEKMSIGIDTYFTQENDDPIVMMMGSLKEVDKPKLLGVLERIKIRQKYIAIGKRCSQ